MKNESFLPIAIAVGVLTAGCMNGTAGELSNGAFAYVCTHESDVTCSSTFGQSDLIPANGVAVGSRFDIAYTGEQPETEDGVSFQVQIVPASPSMVETDGTGFKPKSAGSIAFLGRGANGVVADFVHVTAKDVARLEVREQDVAREAIAIGGGAEVSLTAVPVDAEGQTLGGGFSWIWSSSNEDVLTVDPSGDRNKAQLHGNQAGTATLTVTAGASTQTIPVTVEAQ